MTLFKNDDRSLFKLGNDFTLEKLAHKMELNPLTMQFPNTYPLNFKSITVFIQFHMQKIRVFYIFQVDWIANNFIYDLAIGYLIIGDVHRVQARKRRVD